eukprot:TRINITY_DN7238_c0_g2_i1.p1 TRINITY_DN7238_c0_g2~~TRINITY_DN7238_c0_g2_i1.p1  ORF type:complete len:150 (+),score=2.69 TRINITY_DN7238_c0_g2_i1:26-451(+)
MVPLRAVLSAKFWNEEVESTRSLEAVVKSLPSQPPPLGLLRASKLSRSQQLLLLQQFMRLPCTPSYVHDSGLVGHRHGPFPSSTLLETAASPIPPGLPQGSSGRLLVRSMYAYTPQSCQGSDCHRHLRVGFSRTMVPSIRR